MRSDKIAVYTFCMQSSTSIYGKAAKSLSNYYNLYNVDFHVVDETDGRISEAIETFMRNNTALHHSVITARTLMMMNFLESDADYFVMHDLDYVVANKNLNIREELDQEIICPYAEFSPEFVKDRPPQVRKKKIQTGILADYNPDLDIKLTAHVCADFIAMSRSKVEEMVRFYESVGGDMSSGKTFADYVLAKARPAQFDEDETVKMQEEEFFAAFFIATNNKPHRIWRTKIRLDPWFIKPGADWIPAVIQLVDAVRNKPERYIFYHFGGSDKKNFFDNIVDVFAVHR